MSSGQCSRVDVKKHILWLCQNGLCDYLYALLGMNLTVSLHYTTHLSQGFGLTIGSDFYLVVDRRARRMYYQASSLTPDPTKMTFVHGNFRLINDSMPFAPVSGVIGTVISKAEKMHVVKGTVITHST